MVTRIEGVFGLRVELLQNDLRNQKKSSTPRRNKKLNVGVVKSWHLFMKHTGVPCEKNTTMLYQI